MRFWKGKILKRQKIFEGQKFFAPTVVAAMGHRWRRFPVSSSLRERSNPEGRGFLDCSIFPISVIMPFQFRYETVIRNDDLSRIVSSHIQLKNSDPLKYMSYKR
jgi:hypothetical protein